jgi:hypothetical protein
MKCVLVQVFLMFGERIVWKLTAQHHAIIYRTASPGFGTSPYAKECMGSRQAASKL